MALPFRILLITDGAPALVERVARLRSALDARVALLLRDKQLDRAALLDQAIALRALTRAAGASLLISEHIDVARACDAEGVHLPERASTIVEARAALGPARWVGASRHDRAGVLAAAEAGADYATLSPIFESPGKGAPLGVHGFAEIAALTRLPLIALGGVRAENARALRCAGAAGMAVIREVFAADAPERALAALVDAYDRARSS